MDKYIIFKDLINYGNIVNLTIPKKNYEIFINVFFDTWPDYIEWIDKQFYISKIFMDRTKLINKEALLHKKLINRILIYSEAYKIGYLTHIKKLYLNKKNLIIASNIGITRVLNEQKIPNDLFFIKNKYMKEIFLSGKKNKIPYAKIYDLNDLIKINNSDIVEYDNIFINPDIQFIYSQVETIGYTLLPYILVSLNYALNHLKLNANLQLAFPIIRINNTYKKIFELLCELFEEVEEKNKNNINNIGVTIFFICNNLKKKLSKEQKNQLLKIIENIGNNIYDMNDISNYIYYINSTTKKKFILNYNLKHFDKKYPITIKKINIIDDIKLNTTKGYLSEYLINELNKKYINHFELISYYNSKYITIINSKVLIEKEIIDKILYNNLLATIKSLNKYKIPYNKTYLVYVKEFNKNQLNNFYSFKENINFELINYNNDNSDLKKIGMYNIYKYKELKDIESENISGAIIKKRLINTLPDKKLPYIVKIVSEGFTRGVAKYISKNYNTKVTNAFVKLWEILITIPTIINVKDEINTFHMAEAPGNWIKCTEYYLKNKKINYNWFANSLNHNNNLVKKKYGNVLADDYNYIKNNKNKWLYGVDDTGDITSVKNIKWFQKYFRNLKKKNFKLNLITGDAGIQGMDYEFLQKLDYAQLCLTLAVSSIGSNCIIKHFIYLNSDNDNSLDGSGFFISFIYIYYLLYQKIYLLKPHTSSPNSNEFYLIGIGFLGINDNILNKILYILDNFKENNCFFKKETIPNYFTKQVIEFIDKILTLNARQFEVVNTLITCITHDDPIIKKATECEQYLNIKFVNKIQNKRYKEWINKYNYS